MHNAQQHNGDMRYDVLIRQMMQASSLKQDALARRLRVSQPTISRWLKGQTPDHEQHERIMAEARRLKLVPSPEPLPSSQESGNTRSRSIDETSASVPELEVRGGAAYAGGISQVEADTDDQGHTVAADAVRARWGIPVPFLRDELRLNPSRVHILPVRGDSMNDALFDGDRAIIDLQDTDVSQGGIFAIRDDNGSVIIKQVELVRGHKGEHPRIRCSSRNKNYETFELLMIDPVAIIGRVACKITRL